MADVGLLVWLQARPDTRRALQQRSRWRGFQRRRRLRLRLLAHPLLGALRLLLGVLLRCRRCRLLLALARRLSAPLLLLLLLLRLGAAAGRLWRGGRGVAAAEHRHPQHIWLTEGNV